MKFRDKAYWFFRNLLAFLLTGFADIIYQPLIYYRRLTTLFKNNGSEIIAWPWEWNWRLDGKEND